jgi:polyisoprenoid-binding protein YceI
VKAYLVVFLFSTVWLLVACTESGSITEPADTTITQAQTEPTATPQPANEHTEATATATIAVEATTLSENQPAGQDNRDDVSGTDEPGSAVEVEAPAEPGPDIRSFVIIPEQTQASYIVAEEFLGGALDRLGIQPGLVDTIGSTQEVTGTMELDLNNLTNPVVTSRFAVNLRSLTSDQPRRDNRIREANLESNRYPLAEFAITSLSNTPATYAGGEEVNFQAVGDITIREITRPVTFDVVARLEGDTITGLASTQLRMTDFGFEPPSFANLFTVEDQFVAEVDFTFKEQP